MKCIENILYSIFSTESNQKTCIFFRASVPLMSIAFNSRGTAIACGRAREGGGLLCLALINLDPFNVHHECKSMCYFRDTVV